MRWFVIALAALGCSQDDEPRRAAPSPAPAPAEPPAPRPAPPPAGWGGCDLALGGAFDDHESIDVAQRDAARSRHWTRGDTGEPIPWLAGNCMGKTIRVSFVTAPDVSVPFGPRTYTLSHGKGELLVLARARDKQLVDVSGTIDIAAFDGARVAGTVDLAASAGKARVTITGRFEFPCRGYAACAR
jgi:hypothetical protein